VVRDYPIHYTANTNALAKKVLGSRKVSLDQESFGSF